MTYKDTLTWMFYQLPMYQRQGKKAFKKDLTNIKKLSQTLNFPEKKFKSVHVAGTNGKGSVCHMLASIFQEAGYKTGLYTSPHLKDFRERIRINGTRVSKDFVVTFIADHKTFFEKHQLSFFEMSVGMAFAYFAKEEVDIAIIETGLGGRLDSTNIITPELSVITNIGLDHTKFLGETLPEIAYEKAGIIKNNTPVVIGQKQKLTCSVFKNKAYKTNSPLYFGDEENLIPYKSDLKGDYQTPNIQTVLKSIEVLQHLSWEIKQEHISKGLKKVIKNTGLQGRWQQLEACPKIICDTAHNSDGLIYVMQQIKKQSFQTLHIVLGMVNDKDFKAILPLFPKNAFYYFCQPNVPRGLEASTLAQYAEEYGLEGETYKSTKSALKAAKTNAKKEDFIFVGGSTFTVAEIL